MSKPTDTAKRTKLSVRFIGSPLLRARSLETNSIIGA
jgi:hypothetical protein